MSNIFSQMIINELCIKTWSWCFLHYPLSLFFSNLSMHSRAAASWNITKPRNQFNQDNNIYPEHQKTSGFLSSVWKTVIFIDSWRSWSAILTNITIDIFISRSVKGNIFSTWMMSYRITLSYCDVDTRARRKETMLVVLMWSTRDMSINSCDWLP